MPIRRYQLIVSDVMCIELYMVLFAIIVRHSGWGARALINGTWTPATHYPILHTPTFSLAAVWFGSSTTLRHQCHISVTSASRKCHISVTSASHALLLPPQAMADLALSEANPAYNYTSKPLAVTTFNSPTGGPALVNVSEAFVQTVKMLDNATRLPDPILPGALVAVCPGHQGQQAGPAD